LGKNLWGLKERKEKKDLDWVPDKMSKEAGKQGESGGPVKTSPPGKKKGNTKKKSSKRRQNSLGATLAFAKAKGKRKDVERRGLQGENLSTKKSHIRRS